MHSWRSILFPFSLFYGAGVWLRNRAFDLGLKRSRAFPLPVICVGNLEAGGAGKTPMTEYLVRLLKNTYKISTLSRGYGRNTRGFLEVTTSSAATDTGDEPLQLKSKFPDIRVFADENRVRGIGRIAAESDVVILDDAFQHRYVKAGLNILLFDYKSLQKPKLLLPAGNWRDRFAERRRADVLLVTKCPELPGEERSRIQGQLQVRPDQPVFFSFLAYGNLRPLYPDSKLPKTFNFPLSTSHLLLPTVFLLTGIANPQPLAAFIEQNSAVLHHHRYPDHHAFTPENIAKLVRQFEACTAAQKMVVTTEKDAQRLKLPALQNRLQKLPVFIQPVEMVFLNAAKTEFDRLIGNYVDRDLHHH